MMTVAEALEHWKIESINHGFFGGFFGNRLIAARRPDAWGWVTALDVVLDCWVCGLLVRQAGSLTVVDRSTCTQEFAWTLPQVLRLRSDGHAMEYYPPARPPMCGSRTV
jgi:hypothetical protein